MIPYGKQTIRDEDIQAVVDVLKENNYLTTGHRVDLFEQKLCSYTGAKYCVAVSNGTAALHCAIKAINLKPENEVIVPAISFVASANCVLYMGATVVFCDIDKDTLNIDVNKLESLISLKTVAIISVDMAGNPVNFNEINHICKKYGLYHISDSAHSIGASYNNIKIGNLADLTTFSFHPVKNITTGEGGAILTNNNEFYNIIRRFRSHGIDQDYRNRHFHYYDMIDLGYNYRITDIQCALGISQLNMLDTYISKRRNIAHIYDMQLKPQYKKYRQINGAYHIYIVRLPDDLDRDTVYKYMLSHGVGCNVHYKPIYLHSFYKNLGYTEGLCPIAEETYKQILTLPMYPTLTDDDQNKVINCLNSL